MVELTDTTLCGQNVFLIAHHSHIRFLINQAPYYLYVER